MEPPGKGGAPDADAADPRSAAEADLASVAAEIRHLLETAEEAAAAIRREAEEDAHAASEHLSRLRSALFDLGRLSAQAEGLSRQAETLRDQADAMREELGPRLPEQISASAPGAGADETADGPSPDGERAGRADPFSRSRTRMEAHRMRLAGARRDEVRAFLERRAASEAEVLLGELFGPLGT